MDALCPPIQPNGNPVVCHPVEGYPLGVSVDFAPIQEGEGDPSPDNIRPIKGRDSVQVERCGENLLNISQLIPNGYNLAGSNSLKPNTTYTFKPVSCAGIAFAVFLSDNIEPTQATKQLNLTGKYIEEGKSATFTTPSNVNSYSVIWLAGVKSGIHLAYPNVQFMLVAGTTAPTAYTPYTGQITSLTLPAPCYGGELDAVSGKGQETWKLVTLDGTENWRSWGVDFTTPGITGFYDFSVIDYDVKQVASAICSHFGHPPAAWGGGSAGIGFASVSSTRYLILSVKNDLLADTSSTAAAIDSLKAYLAAQYAAGTPVTVAYIKSTPTPITATGSKPIPALAGTNTVLTDGDALTVTGRTDPTHEIQQLRAAVVALGGTI